tara:strand:- start:4016 stop:4570 length:555 start_codon:yes stop_codon:yes gene_type:complete
MKPVIVQLGNAMDTSGASIEYGFLFHTREGLFGKTDFIVTSKGIAMAEEMRFGWYYSTACLPLSYAPSIESEWEVNIPVEVDEMLANAKTLEHGIKSTAILSSMVSRYAVRHLAELALTTDDEWEASKTLRVLRSALVDQHGHEKATSILNAVLSKAFAEPRIAAQLGYEPKDAPATEELVAEL